MEIIRDQEMFSKRKNIKIIKLNIGCLDSEDEIEIKLNKPIYGADKLKCPHLGPKYIVRFFQNNETSDIIYADCPRVITSKYENCDNSIEICLDCVLEQFKEE